MYHRSDDISRDISAFLADEDAGEESRPTCDCCGEKVVSVKMLRIFGKTICWDCVDEHSEYVED